MVTLASVFGAQVSGIDKYVENFDFSRCIDVKDNTKEDYLHVGLAPAYGELTSKTIKSMDEQLKLMIRLHNGGLLSWDDITSTFESREPNTVERYDSPVQRENKFIKPSRLNFFKVDGSPDPVVVREVHTWFTKFIGDSDVLRSTQINIDVLGAIVAQTGATITSFETFFYGHEHHEKRLVDVGVLRFPDFEHPYFQIYRIKLEAWSCCERYIFVQEDSNGINGEYTASTYRPTKSAYDSIIGKRREDAIKEAEDIFS
ncbi:hypothetical protein CPB84DRAFT_1794725 [Gymnopilus junonius]|uniref:Uncharacterized protein n=1 Tax=Gymnopilus junonius TaxID=109634 RepID=A0A9P5THC7_GYMJU|nr:hypothetical protein CPB84DRAFT_1794725 [Gymnopilus junonius]